MVQKIKAILALDPDAEVTVINDAVTWHDGNPNKITEEQINTKLAEMQSTFDGNEYQRKRKAEYPSIADQLDKIYHEGIDKWKSDMIKPVKDKYPKE